MIVVGPHHQMIGRVWPHPSKSPAHVQRTWATHLPFPGRRRQDGASRCTLPLHHNNFAGARSLGDIRAIVGPENGIFVRKNGISVTGNWRHLAEASEVLVTCKLFPDKMLDALTDHFQTAERHAHLWYFGFRGDTGPVGGLPVGAVVPRTARATHHQYNAPGDRRGLRMDRAPLCGHGQGWCDWGRRNWALGDSGIAHRPEPDKATPHTPGGRNTYGVHRL